MNHDAQTVLYNRHIASGAQMVSFGGWSMPLTYAGGILAEHLTTRRAAGVFDVSHMGRFTIRGIQAIQFLRYALTNDAAALAIGQSHYTMLADSQGGAIDDAYLFRYRDDSYMLVVNAANRVKDWLHLLELREKFKQVQLEDQSAELAMLSVQGPRSETVIGMLLEAGSLPAPHRNATSIARFAGSELLLSRTGYTGEPLGFELCASATKAATLWDRLLEEGVQPVGLGARDTLRLEAALPLYGHELGRDREGSIIPIFALPLARFAVRIAPERGDFVGRQALELQMDSLRATQQAAYNGAPKPAEIVPRQLRPLEILEPGIARAGAELFFNGQPSGFVTSGTMVPFWNFTGDGAGATISETSGRRSIALALIDRNIKAGDIVMVDVRGKRLRAGVMPALLSGKFPPFARALTWGAYRRRLTTEQP